MPETHDFAVREQVATLTVQITDMRADLLELKQGQAQFLIELKEYTKSGDQAINELKVRNMSFGKDIEALQNAEKEHDERIKAIEDLMPIVKVMAWVGAIMGASIIALIWAIITHTVSIVVP